MKGVFTMRNITTGDTGLVLDDFFTSKINLVQSTLAFQLFGASLAEKREQLTSIRKGLEKKPLVEALKDDDLMHDCTGRALYFICTGLDQPACIEADAKTQQTAGTVADDEETTTEPQSETAPVTA
jgi:hypothetical protein